MQKKNRELVLSDILKSIKIVLSIFIDFDLDYLSRGI